MTEVKETDKYVCSDCVGTYVHTLGPISRSTATTDFMIECRLCERPMVSTDRERVRIGDPYRILAAWALTQDLGATMPESIVGLPDRIRCNGEIIRYLSEKVMDFAMGGFNPQEKKPYSVPAEPNEQACFVIKDIAEKYFEEIVYPGVQEITKKHNCRFVFRYTDFAEDDDYFHVIVFYTVNT
jgi:hypothetical protein